MQKVTPFLWFDNNAEKAMEFYVSIFPNSKIISKFPMGRSFEIEGQQLSEILCDSDSKKSWSVMNAMLKMKKLDIETLKNA